MVDLRNGDCLELMKDIPDGSVDMVLADLPYGCTRCKWDSVIDIPQMFECFRKIIKPGGVIALFGQEPFSTKLRIACMDWYKYDWYWQKNKPANFVHAKNMPMRNVELISVFSQGAINHKSLSKLRMPYNPQGLIYSPHITRGISNVSSVCFEARPSHKEQFISEYTGYPTQTLRYDIVPHNKLDHPTQKPVALLEYLIKTYTNPGETVIDPTMGSGSTGVACINTGRDFIGIEKDEHYFEVAKQRIQEAETHIA